MKPRLLDLFCGQGGASTGYAHAGFEVVGVDIAPQPRYPFEFHQADALEFPLAGFDVIAASPPCQAYSVATPDKSRHPDLIAAVRARLNPPECDWLYVIENVVGAPLIAPTLICGSSLGLRVRRHRLFESNVLIFAPPCVHATQGQPVGVYGGGTGTGQKRGRKVMSSAEALEVMEMPWADRAGATQAIPPTYTELIGAQLLDHLRAKAAA